MYPSQIAYKVSGSASPTPHAAFPSAPVLFKALEPHATGISCKEDRTLFSQGDRPSGVFLVRSGTVQAVVHSDNGRASAIFHADPGAILGLPAVTSDQPYSLSALARQGSEVAFVSKDVFERVLENEPGLYMVVLRVLATEVQAAREALTRQ